MFVNKVIILILLLFQCTNPHKIVFPKAVNGILDLRNWDFQKDGNIQLDGEWEFYPNEFLKPIPLWEADRKFETKKFIKVPSKWESFQKENGLEKIYFGTYRLRVILPDEQTYLSIKIPSVSSAYSIYSNGVLLAKVGTISQTKDEYKPGNNLKVNDFLFEQVDVEILVHVANFDYENGSGLWESLNLGLSPNIQRLARNTAVLDAIIFGILFIMATYHFSYYYFRRKEKTAFYFGLTCLCISLRTVLYGENLALELPFLKDHYFLSIKLEFISLYLILPSSVLYLKSIFQENLKNNVIIKIFIFIGIFYSFTGIFTGISIYTHPIIIISFQFIFLAMILFLMGMLPLLVIQKRDGAKSLAFGLSISLIVAINDTLNVNRVLNTSYIGPFGFIAFVFANAIVLSKRFSKGFIESENLTAKLTYLNANLENSIKERTKALEDTKQEIEDINNFIYLVNSLSDLNSIFIEISKYFYHKFGITGSWLFLPDEQKEFLYAYKAYSYFKLPDYKYDYLINKKIPLKYSEGGMLYQTYQRKKSFYLYKIPKFEFAIDKEFVETLNIKSFLYVPLIRKNECVGILAFSNLEKEMKLFKKQINFISNLCAGIAGSIDTNHLLKQTEEAKIVANKEKENALIAQFEAVIAKQEVEKLNEFTKKINENFDLDEILNLIGSYISENFNISHYFLWKMDKNKLYLNPYKGTFSDNLTEEDIKIFYKIKIPIQEAKGIHATVYKTKRTVFIKGMKRRKSSSEEENTINELLGIESLLIVPLIIQNQVIGTMDFSHYGEILSLSKSEIQKISIFCEQIAGVIYGASLFEDTVHAKKEIEKLAESRKRLSAVGQMVAGIVHDIKNPIASIKGFAESLNSDKLKPEKRDRNTKMIIQEMERLSDMVYEILDFSKGNITLELSTVQLSEYLKEILSFQQTNLDYHSIKAITDFQFNDKVELDTSRIRRVLVNLIQNSIEVMYDGKKKYFVKISTREEEEYCIFAVEDNGPGLPASFEEKIFEAFATEGKAKGTGLGLFMSKWIVEAHGGTLTYNTKLGEGTTFFIKIPKTQKGRELENEKNTDSG